MSGKNIVSVKTAGALDYIAVLFSIIIWSASFVGMKIAVGQAHPMVVLWLRMMICVPVLFAGSVLQKSFRLPEKKEFFPLLIMGFQGIFLVLALQNYAMRTASAATANWIIICSPAFVAILGWIFLKERISGIGFLGLLLSALGVITVLKLGMVRTSVSGHSSGTVGDLLILLSSLNWSIFLVFSRKVLRDDLPYSFVLFWEMFFSLIFSTVFVFALGCDISVVTLFTAKTWCAVIFLGIGASAAAYFCWFRGLSVLPVAKIVAFQFLQPFAGAIVAYMLLGEHFTVWLFAGGLTIMFGVWLVNKK